MPAFSNEDRRVQTAQTAKQSAVELAADLIARADEGQAVEVAASSAKTGSNLVSAAAGDPLVRTTPVKQKTIVRKIPNNPNTAYYLQAGAFTNNNDANRMQDQLVSAGMDAFVKTVAIDGQKWHRVRIGPFYDSDTLYSAQTRLGRSGISYLVIKVQS
jgi:cell division protein FtsN